MAREWDVEDALASLVSRTMDENRGDTKKTAEMIFNDNVALAAQSLVHAAVHSDNERIRLDASKYIVERVLGRLGESKDVAADPLQELFNEAMKAVE
jgi:uncharacterized membrane protein YheB (UPF0754 family)